LYGRFLDSERFDDIGGNGGESCFGKFAYICGEVNACGCHLVDDAVAYDVYDDFALFDDVVEGVFGGIVLDSSVGGEDECRWIGAKCVEKAVWGEIGLSVFADGAGETDGTGGNCA